MKTKEVELRPSEYEVHPNKSTNSIPDGTITTASTPPASSPDSDTSDIFMIENPLHQSRRVNLLESFNEVATPQINAIADRIRPTFEIHLSPEEKITHSIVHDINWSFLTPIGLQQYDFELKKITVVLSVEELQNLGLGEFVEEARNLRFDEEAHLSYDELVEAKKKTNINDRLTLEQWKNLEIALIKSPYGRTVIGYSINEEVYLKFWGHVFQLYYQSLKHLGYPARDYQYPPRIDDIEKLMLNFCQKKIIKDIRLASKVAGYISGFILLSFLYLYAYLENKNNSFENIFNKFIECYFILSCCLLGGSLLALNIPFLNHKLIEDYLNKFVGIIYSLLGNINRLRSYLPLICPYLSPKTLVDIIVYSSPALIITTIYMDLKKKTHINQNSYINISQYPYINFIYQTLSWSSFNQSVLSSGSTLLVNLKFYFNNDDVSVEEYDYIMNILFFTYFCTLFVSHLNINPLINAPNINYFGLYLCNIENGVISSIFDAWNFFSIIYLPASLTIFKNDTPTRADYINNSCYFGVLSLTYLSALFIGFSNTPNILKYSLRILPESQKPSLFRRGLNYLFSKNNEEKNDNLTLQAHSYK